MGDKRFIEFKKTPLLLGLLFSILLFGTTLLFKQELPDLFSYKISEFISKFGDYIPLVIGLSTILIHYILLLINYILRLKFSIAYILISLLVYGFWLFIGIDLLYLEPRYTDLAIALIDLYGLPLLLSSSSIILIILVFSFLKKKHKD